MPSSSDVGWLRGTSGRSLAVCRVFELAANGTADDFCETHWNRVADLPHAATPSARKTELVGKSLEACAFANGEVPDAAIPEIQYVFAAWYPMAARFERLRWF